MMSVDEAEILGRRRRSIRWSEPVVSVTMSKLRKAKWLLLGIVAVIAVGSSVTVVKTEKQHFANYGHYVSYGWHVDVGTVTPDPQFAAPYLDPNGGGIIVPAEGQWTRILNFTVFPALVEACMNGKTPVFPLLLEKLDPATQEWTVVPPYQGQTCLNLPIRTNVIWPLESFNTMPVPIARLSVWFHKGDWVRIVALSKCNGPLEAQREFRSPPFQITEENLRGGR